jgi:Zn-dependent protease with chaperone function
LLPVKKVYNEAMKNLSLLIIILFLTSCATTQQSSYVIPKQILARPTLMIHQRLHQCMELTKGNPNDIRVAESEEPNAMVGDDNIVVLTSGFFKHSNEVLAFVIAHELAHVKLNHVRNIRAVSVATTGAFIVIGVFIPGAASLNHIVNPAVTNNYSKSQEYEADKLASETLTKCFKFTIEKQVQILQEMDDGSKGGFWATHPAWKDRIEAIKQPPR